jgi:hypothetical protein
MDGRSTKLSVVEALLCLWVIAAPIWYLFQFRPLLAFFAARFLHKQ